MQKALPQTNYPHPKDLTPPWHVAEDYEGTVLIWDLDKTYLATEFESLWGLIKTAFEAPEKKKNISGTVALLKHLRRDTAQAGRGEAPLFFISATPPQMRKKIEAKFKLDGLDFTHIYFKDQWRHMKRGEFRMMRNHVGYKIIQLIRIWYHLPKTCQLILFGDDMEGDTLSYNLFADICNHTLTGKSLIYLLRDLGISRREAIPISYWQRSLPPFDPIEKIYIHLVSKTDPQYYAKYGDRVFPSRNAFQIALSEYFAGRLKAEGVSAVAYEMHVKDGLSTFKIRKSAEDFLKRKKLKNQWEDSLWDSLMVQHLLDEKPAANGRDFVKTVELLRDPIEASTEDLRIRMKYYDDIR